MNRKKIKTLLTILLVCISVGFFVFYLIRNYQNLPHIRWNIETALGGVGSLLIYTANIIIVGMIWFILLKDYGVKISRSEAIGIVCFSQFGKYLPGNVGQHVGRVVLANEKKIPTLTTLQTIFIETVILAIVGISISILGFFSYSFEGFTDSRVLISQLLLLILAALILPKFAFFLINRFATERFLKFAGGMRLRIPGFSTLTLVAFFNILTFTNLGIILDLIGRTFFGHPESNIFFLTTAFAWSWILGYLAPGAPAGLGIREAVIVASLSTRYEPGTAIGLSIVLRFITTIGDGAVFLIASYFRKKIA